MILMLSEASEYRYHMFLCTSKGLSNVETEMLLSYTMLVLFVFAMNSKNAVFIICAAAFYGDVLVHFVASNVVYYM